MSDDRIERIARGLVAARNQDREQEDHVRGIQKAARKLAKDMKREFSGVIDRFSIRDNDTGVEITLSWTRDLNYADTKFGASVSKDGIKSDYRNQSFPKKSAIDVFKNWKLNVSNWSKAKVEELESMEEELDAYDAHMDGMTVFYDFEKSSDFSEHISWTKVSSYKSSSSKERGNWVISIRIEPSDEARAKGAKDYDISASYVDRGPGEVTVDVSWGPYGDRNSKKIKPVANELKRLMKKVLGEYYGKVEKGALMKKPKSKPKPQRSIEDDLDSFLLDSVDAGDRLMDRPRDLKDEAAEFNRLYNTDISSLDVRSSLKRLVRDGDLFQEGNGWTMP